jgi:BirA family transcriptional regulator, biotin operon repressor / biotin---[acetyl-CoA-carboxylase] ligase
MDQASLESVLADLHLPAIRFFNSIDSTNAEAWRWIEAGAPHAALVIADEQTAGRGRLQRHWTTVAGSGLAFSMAVLPPSLELANYSRLTGLGALAACQALQTYFSLPARIKWPNDILLEGRKAGGVLVESRWSGDVMNAVVIGIGINIAPESIDPHNLPPQSLNFPVACIEGVLKRPVDRIELLHVVLQKLLDWLPRLASGQFIRTWEDYLAYRGQWVEISHGEVDSNAVQSLGSPKIRIGKVMGLTSDGSLQLSSRSKKVFTVQGGEIHLRPVPLRQPD